MNKTEKAIIKTLAFFDTLGRPLTLEEIWRFLYGDKASKLEVLLGLRKLMRMGKIFNQEPYYSLPGRQNIIEVFQKKKELCRQRWQGRHQGEPDD